MTGSFRSWPFDGAILVEALDARLMVEAGPKPVADEAAERLHAVLDSLGI